MNGLVSFLKKGFICIETDLAIPNSSMADSNVMMKDRYEFWLVSPMSMEIYPELISLIRPGLDIFPTLRMNFEGQCYPLKEFNLSLNFGSQI